MQLQLSTYANVIVKGGYRKQFKHLIFVAVSKSRVFTIWCLNIAKNSLFSNTY